MLVDLFEGQSVVKQGKRPSEVNFQIVEHVERQVGRIHRHVVECLGTLT